MIAAGATPDGIASRHIDETRGPPAGTFASIILGAFLLAALLGWLGGMPSQHYVVMGNRADLEVHIPRIMRSGMFFETRIAVTAHEPLSDVKIAMSPRLWRSITINTQIPEPTKQAFENGLYAFRFGPLKPGERFDLKLDVQVNPDLFLGNRGEVVLLDGDIPLQRVPIALTVLP